MSACTTERNTSRIAAVANCINCDDCATRIGSVGAASNHVGSGDFERAKKTKCEDGLQPATLSGNISIIDDIKIHQLHTSADSNAHHI